MLPFLPNRLDRRWKALAVALALVAAAAIAVFATNLGRPKGQWMSDPKTGCRIWDDLPEPDQSVSWSGPCKDGLADGRGVAQWTIKGKPEDRYEGEMRGGKMAGTGILSFPNGMRYEGEFRNNTYTGHGRLTYSNGDVYVGEFLDDHRSGKGTLFMKDGQQYVGGWTLNMPDGPGTLTRPDGTSASGMWKKGCLKEGAMKGFLIATARECKID